MAGIEQLLALMARLRDPRSGCPWDVEQSFETIAPYTIEEAYEVDDAIRRGELGELREELGDLLLQVVFHAQMAREAGHFAFEDVVATLCDKLVRRHPHVFGEASVASADEQVEAWEAHKAAERAARGEGGAALEAVPLGLPALLRAQKLVRRALRASLPLDLPDLDAAWRDFREALTGVEGPARSEAVGALLLAVAARAGEAGVDAEQALRDANARLVARRRRAGGGAA
jgi:ATP diphosphatase